MQNLDSSVYGNTPNETVIGLITVFLIFLTTFDDKDDGRMVGDSQFWKVWHPCNLHPYMHIHVTAWHLS